MAKNTIANESPKNYSKKRKISNNKVRGKVVSVTDVRYCYPKTMDEMWPKRGYIEYKMPMAMILDLLNGRNKAEEKIDPQKYLCDYVNDQYDLMRYCVRVIAG